MGRRDTAINIALGSVLLLTAALIFLVTVSGLWVSLFAIKHSFYLLFPGVAVPGFLTPLLLYVFWSLCYGIDHLRRKLWRGAFLCFLIIPVMVLASFSDRHSGLGLNLFPAFWLLCILSITPPKSPISSVEFFTITLIATAVIASTSVLLGSGKLPHIV
jgi:hypothetical protein